MSAPTLDRPPSRPRTGEPVPVRRGPDPRLRSRVRVQWLALAAALVVLAGTLVAWALGRAADRVTVVAVARPVPAGDVIDAGDLTTAEVAIDASVTGLVPTSSLDAVIGRVAAVDLGAGALLTVGMWSDPTGLGAGERSVGAVLSPGRFPSGLGHGSTAAAIEVRAGTTTRTTDGADTDANADDDTTADAATPIDGSVIVRILDVTTTDAGDLSVTLAVPTGDADAVATWAATGSLALIGMPDLTPASTATSTKAATP